MERRSWAGGCHCGALRFRASFPREVVIECNCSICTKKGFLHLICGPEDLVAEVAPGALATYTFGTGVAQHHFCRRCGQHPFYRPRSHPEGFSVNARCLDDPAWRSWPIEPFDGDRWEASIAALRARTSPPSEEGSGGRAILSAEDLPRSDGSR